MKKATVNYEHTHSLQNDEDDSHEIILERDPFLRRKSHRIAVLSGQNGLEEKPSKSNVELPSKNRRSWEREEEVLLTNDSSLDDEDAARKLRKWSKSKIDLLMPSLRSLVTLARGKSSSATSLNQPGSAESWSHLECVKDDEPIRKYNTMVTLSNVVLNRPAGIKPINRLRDTAVCSRCSSVLSLAASSSRYSLGSTSSFVTHRDQPIVLCKVCLNEVPVKNSWTLQQCGCSYCIEVSNNFVLKNQNIFLKLMYT
jgi:E3 ubiquitin-protein ligase RNF144